MKTENQVNCYKWRESEGKEKWSLLIYHVYPDLGPVGTANRGPYCINQIQVKSSDRAGFESKLAELQAEPVENYL